MHKVVLYARLSVTTEESVSITRQLGSARKYSEARGWDVLGEYVDDGVSASKFKPEDRPGWRSLLEAEQRFDAVVVWKIDRLARRVLDFLHADEALQKRGAGIVAVEDPVDMTTPQGRAFATMLAVFGEMEAAAISSRVRAAREALIKAGRRTGGRPPFGYRNLPNPDGAGMVLGQDPERIEVVQALVAKAMEGASLYSLAQWLASEGVSPRPRRVQGSAAGSDPVPAKWHDASVEAILRSPTLAGMTPYRGDVLRGVDGLPIVDDSTAIITPAERRRLLDVLERAKKPGSRSRAGTEPALLYGMIRCASCDGLMYRATAAKKYRQYRCQQRGCPAPVGVSRDAVEKHVTDMALATVGGDAVVVSQVSSSGDENSLALAEIEASVRETAAQMVDDGADIESLAERLQALKEARTRARAGQQARPTYKVTGRSFATTWKAAEDVERRRQLLMTRIEVIRVKPGGGRGRAFDRHRIEIVWRSATPTAEAQRREDILFMRAWQQGPS